MPNIKIGFIKYLNSMPFYHDYDGTSIENAILQRCPADCKVSIIYETPARLNKMIAGGEIDVATISSYHYIINRDHLQMFGKVCISAFKEVMSVLMLTRKPVIALSNKTFLLSDESASAATLLKIMARDFYGNENLKYKPEILKSETLDKLLDDENIAGALIIGDEALKYYEKANNSNDTASAAYDLCKEWNRFTSLPFVFGLLTAKKDFYFENKTFCDNLTDVIKLKLNYFKANIDVFASKTSTLSGLEQGTMKKYYERLCYDFSHDHCMALEEFEKRIKKYREMVSE